MKPQLLWMRIACLFMAVLLAMPLGSLARAAGEDTSQKKLSQEELAQLLAPIALYPDELVAQILMASTYPIEVVQADRWAKSHKQSAGDALAKQLEKESWDPSVKSLVSFPTVLASMSEKLDVTTKIGDAFLAQQKEVMETIQLLRKKAYEAGNLKTTKEQKIVVEKEIIIIQPANPQVIYVPTYSPTVVYGVWAYPAYPPYYYYPPPPPYAPAFAFAAGVAIGAAWSNNNNYGNCNWHGNNVYVNNSRNTNINYNQNANINRSQAGQGAWQHNPEHRKGVAYKDGATAQRYGQSAAQTGAARNAARGYGSGGAGAAAGARPSAASMDRSSAAASGRDSAFSGRAGSGQQERAASDRGQASRQSASAGNRSMPSTGFGGSGASRSSSGFSGGGGGAARGGGGGGRGGGGRR